MGEVEVSGGGIGIARGAELGDDRGNARDRGKHRQHQDQHAALVLTGGAAMHQREIEARDHDEGQHEIDRDRDIPADENARRHPLGGGAREEYRHADGQGCKQPAVRLRDPQRLRQSVAHACARHRHRQGKRRITAPDRRRSP